MYYLFWGKYQTDAKYYNLSLNKNSELNGKILATTAFNAKTLIKSLPVGSHIRVKVGKSYGSTSHSIIIAARDNTYVTVYDANGQRDVNKTYNLIQYQKMTYAQFASYFPRIIFFNNGVVAP